MWSGAAATRKQRKLELSEPDSARLVTPAEMRGGPQNRHCGRTTTGRLMAAMYLFLVEKRRFDDGTATSVRSDPVAIQAVRGWHVSTSIDVGAQWRIGFFRVGQTVEVIEGMYQAERAHVIGFTPQKMRVRINGKETTHSPTALAGYRPDCITCDHATMQQLRSDLFAATTAQSELHVELDRLRLTLDSKGLTGSTSWSAGEN